MPIAQTKLEKFADQFIAKDVPFKQLKRERLWVLNTTGMAVFGIFLTIVELSIGTSPLVSALCFSLFIVGLSNLFLTKYGYSTFAKLLAHLHVSAVIILITAIYSEDAFAWAFFIPVCISAMSVFRPSQRFYILLIHAVSFLSLPIYLTYAPQHSIEPLSQLAQNIPLYWMINFTGAMTFSMYTLYSLISLNESIFQELLKKEAENAHQNKIMLGSIRTRDKLLSMMSHDIRGDIGKTIGVVDVIEQMPLSKEDQATLLHNLKMDAVKTLETLDNMLQWTRTQQDELSIQLTPCQVDRIISQLLNNHEYNISSKRIKVQLQVPGKLVIDADQNMIDSVFRNLLGNAIKFTPIGGIISISAKKLENTIEFSIQDSGVGMTAEQIDNITKGVQFTTRGTNREKGRGFGMVLVQEFLHKHKSKLNIESTVGKGSCFSFELPIHNTK